MTGKQPPWTGWYTDEIRQLYVDGQTGNRMCEKVVCGTTITNKDCFRVTNECVQLGDESWVR